MTENTKALLASDSGKLEWKATKDGRIEIVSIQISQTHKALVKKDEVFVLAWANGSAVGMIRPSRGEGAQRGNEESESG